MVDERSLATLLARAVGLAAELPASGLEEPPLVAPAGMKCAAGIVLIDEYGPLTIREPANHYDGYEHSYAKGRVESAETPQQTSRRELTEETGLQGLVVRLIGDFKGHVTITRFYAGVRTGGTESPSDETWARRPAG